MQKSPLTISFMTIALIFATVPLRSVQGLDLSDVKPATMSVSDPPDTEAVTKQEGSGNGFLRALTAPFRAIGRIFSRGKKDNNKLQRISKKDIKNFEARPTNAALVKTATTPRQPISSASAQEHMEKGRALLKSGNLNEAIEELSTSVSLDPKQSEAHTLLGIAYDRKGLNDLARRSLETARHASDDQAMHLNNLGYLLYRNGDYKGAVKHLKEAAKLAPNDGTIWNNLALAQYRQEKYADALKSFVKAQGDFQGRLNLAAAFANSGLVEEAARHYKAALQLRPGSTEVLAKLVGLYKLLGRSEDAEAARILLIANEATAAASGVGH
jgi:Flp pilus assembly protein TadD